MSEIAKCPNPECGDICVPYKKLGNNYAYQCDCGYCGPWASSRKEAIRLHNLIASPPPGHQLVPKEPTEAQWSGLARAIIMWMDMSDGPKLPRDLLKHLERSGQDIPQWLLNEPEMQTLDHSMSKGARTVIIYKAMLAAAEESPDEM